MVALENFILSIIAKTDKYVNKKLLKKTKTRNTNKLKT